MTPKDILGLVIRICGLLFLAYGLYDVYYAVVEAAGYTVDSRFPASEHAIFGSIKSLAALAIVRFADKIVAFTYK